MNPETNEVFAACVHNGTEESSFYISENTLVYVSSGEWNVNIANLSSVTINEGECIFIRKDQHFILKTFSPENNSRAVAVLLSFSRQILFDYYKTLYKLDLLKNVERSHKSFTTFRQSSLLTSLFDSFKPYWQKGETPEKHWLRIKILEAIRLLLVLDESIYQSLFDFSSQWKLDIMDFMEHNYRYDLNIREIAQCTGRSLSSFKRDFSKLSDQSPRNWIISRRLREAHRLLQSTDWSIYKVMHTVGFKNFSHFSRRYRECYGETPGTTQKKQGKI